MRCKAVAERVRGHGLADLGHVGGGVAGAPELARRVGGQIKQAARLRRPSTPARGSGRKTVDPKTRLIQSQAQLTVGTEVAVDERLYR
jgi:hypothetical protein